MTVGTSQRSGRTGSRPCGLSAARLSPVAVTVAVVVALSGCSSTAADSATAGGQAVPSAGAYAIATAGPQVLNTPEASESHYQLVAAGTPVRVSLGDATAVAAVAGPDLTITPGPPATHAPGVLTVTVSAEHGSLGVDPARFLALDQAQDPVALTADSGPTSAQPGHPVALHLSADFATGHTTLTWQPTGQPMVTWDFVVEID